MKSGVSLRCARSILVHTSHYSRLEKPTTPLATQERHHPLWQSYTYSVQKTAGEAWYGGGWGAILVFSEATSDFTSLTHTPGTKVCMKLNVQTRWIFFIVYCRSKTKNIFPPPKKAMTMTFPRYWVEEASAISPFFCV